MCCWWLPWLGVLLGQDVPQRLCMTATVGYGRAIGQVVWGWGAGTESHPSPRERSLSLTAQAPSPCARLCLQRHAQSPHSSSCIGDNTIAFPGSNAAANSGSASNGGASNPTGGAANLQWAQQMARAVRAHHTRYRTCRSFGTCVSWCVCCVVRSRLSLQPPSELLLPSSPRGHSLTIIVGSSPYGHTSRRKQGVP